MFKAKIFLDEPLTTILFTRNFLQTLKFCAFVSLHQTQDERKKSEVNTKEQPQI